MESIITGTINYFINHSNKKSEERKHQLSLIMQAAIENWKQQLDSAFKLAKPGETIPTLPLDAYIVHMSKLSDVLLDKKTSSENITEKIKELKKSTKATNKVFEDLENSP